MVFHKYTVAQAFDLPDTEYPSVLMRTISTADEQVAVNIARDIVRSLHKNVVFGECEVANEHGNLFFFDDQGNIRDI